MALVRGVMRSASEAGVHVVGGLVNVRVHGHGPRVEHRQTTEEHQRVAHHLITRANTHRPERRVQPAHGGIAGNRMVRPKRRRKLLFERRRFRSGAEHPGFQHPRHRRDVLRVENFLAHSACPLTCLLRKTSYWSLDDTVLSAAS